MSNEIDLIVMNSACKIWTFAHVCCDGKAGHKTWSFASPQMSVLLMKFHIFNDCCELGYHFD